MNQRPLRPERSALAKLSYSPINYNQSYTITTSKLQSTFIPLNSLLLSDRISLQNTSQFLLFLGPSGALEVPFPLCCRSPFRMRRSVNQRPRTILSSVPSTPSGIMLLEPLSQVIGVPNIEFLCLKTFKYINVIHQNNLCKWLVFTTLWLTSDLP